MVGIKLQQSDFKQVGALVRIITKTISQISLNFFIFGIAVKLMNSLIDFNFCLESSMYSVGTYASIVRLISQSVFCSGLMPRF